VDECLDIKDFHILLTEMVGELNASHTGASPAPTGGRGGEGGGRGETASLGVWFDWSGNGPGMKVTGVLREGPADRDESRIKVGEYVLAVNGQDVTPTEAFVRSLWGQGGKTLDVLVNSSASKIGARTVKLNAISRGQFSGLLYEHWVQRNMDEVARLSQNKLAYLHIKAMDQPSLQRFERELVTEAYDKEGLVLDVRNNGGGRIHDELFALLTAKVHAYETPRDGLKMTQPFGAFNRKMILLINGSSFSDAEIFPNGFRANGLGKIVGVPTGGGVIGTGDITLLDNLTRFRVPRTGWHTLDGRNLENWGVPPDYYVEITPADHLAGIDPQLERATKELLKELKAKRPGK
jgi:tricorn protease